MKVWAFCPEITQKQSPSDRRGTELTLELVIITALCVGGSTALGALIGYMTKGVSKAFGDKIMAFAAGVMLAAAIIGLIVPSFEAGEGAWIAGAAFGVFAGAIFIDMLDKAAPLLRRLAGRERTDDSSERARGVTLFVLAIALHNLPEGIAAGVGFGTGNVSDAFLIAAGIALQNIPEGMVIVSPMMSVGMKPSRALLYASLTGVLEVIGTFIGYFAIGVSEALLPFLLAFAGGTMLYVISDEMIPEIHSGDDKRNATYALLFGFVLMMVFDKILG